MNIKTNVSFFLGWFFDMFRLNKCGLEDLGNFLDSLFCIDIKVANVCWNKLSIVLIKAIKDTVVFLGGGGRGGWFEHK